MKGLVEFIAKSIVDNPELVKVNQDDSDDTIHIELIASGDDIGKLVGKNGQTVKALRTILNASAVKARKRVILDVKESGSSEIKVTDVIS